MTRPVSGGAGTARAALPGWPTRRGRAGRGRSRPWPWPRLRPWPASRPQAAGSRWPAGPAPSWPARQPLRIVTAVSASTVRRWLADDAIKPWQHRSWIFPHDPHFALKGGLVLDLYQRTWEGQQLGARPWDPHSARGRELRRVASRTGRCSPRTHGIGASKPRVHLSCMGRARGPLSPPMISQSAIGGHVRAEGRHIRGRTRDRSGRAKVPR